MSTKTRAEAAEEFRERSIYGKEDERSAFLAGIEWFIENELRGLLEEAKYGGKHSIDELIQRAKGKA